MPTPVEIEAKKCTINVRLPGDRCFLYAVAAGLDWSARKEEGEDPLDHPNRAAHFDAAVAAMNVAGMKFPVEVRAIRRFDNANDVGVFVIG